MTSSVADCSKYFKWASSRLFQGILFSLLLSCFANSSSSQPRNYPEELHRRVMEKLHQRDGREESGKIGNWGPWSNWSSCSRSCGTGVMTQSRECRMTHHSRKRTRRTETNGTNRCVGRYKRFQLCNTQDCPEGLVDFRREQCAAFDRTPFNSRFYSWEPFINSPDSCALNCRASGLNFYATLNHSVVDGTPCGAFQPHTKTLNRICVAGRCMKVGCDDLLGSGREVDACGVCGGDNSTCRLISGVYARANLPFGYNLIATLPPKAENLSFYHVKPSMNYLAVREIGGNYLLNGPAGMNSSGSFATSGTIFTYSRPHAYGGDHLYARGPITHSLDVMLFYQSPDPGIIYEYRLPTRPGVSGPQSRLHLPDNSLNPAVPRRPLYRNSPPPGIVNDAISSISITNNRITSVYKNEKNEKKEKFKKEREKKLRNKEKAIEKEHRNIKRRKRYSWIVSGFTPCSQTCGGGTQTTRTVCVKTRKKHIEIPPQFCAGLPQPPEEVVRCNLKPCPAQWEAGRWSACSVTCAMGIQTRELFCRQRISTELTIDAPDDACQSVPKIPKAQVCQMRECNGPPKWELLPWSSCSAECGLGTRKRDVICTNSFGKVKENLCEQPQPSQEEVCDMGSCATDTWYFSSWDKVCMGPCGEGIQKRRVYCPSRDVDGKMSSCLADSKPTDSKQCENTEACVGSWFVGPWSDCDVHCGTGRQRRAVVCVTWTRGRYKVSKDTSPCKASGERPTDSRSCAVDCKAEWFMSEWSTCSSSCGDGVQRREIKCLDQKQQPSLECFSDTKPDSRQNCNIQPCPVEHLNDSAAHLQRPPNDSTVLSDESKTGSSKDPEDGTQKISSAKGSEDDYEWMVVIREGGKLKLNKVYEIIGNETYYFPRDQWGPGVCQDRMKNCRLVYKARLCRLKYYNRLCCQTCSNN